MMPQWAEDKLRNKFASYCSALRDNPHTHSWEVRRRINLLIDELLDSYLAMTLLVTEYDADKWGFDPDTWMQAERAEIAALGGEDWPTAEPCRVIVARSL